MDCAEFRRRLLEDPAGRAPEFLAHRAGCGTCDRAAGEVERLEADLANLLAVAPRADLRRRLAKRARRRAWVPLAAAACLAGVLVPAMLNAPGPLPGHAAFVDDVVRHVAQEPRALEGSRALPAARWRDLSPTVTVDTDGWSWPVTYAAPCELMKHPGLHLVLRGAGGPVTVLVIVDYRVETAALQTAGAHRAIFRPLDRGTLVVLATDAASPVAEIAAAVAPRIHIHA